jgi:hypothetical protein
MKFSVLALSLIMVFVAACAPESPTSTDTSTGMAKAAPDRFEFQMPIYSDCCGDEFLVIDIKYHQVVRDNGVSYSWKANQQVTGASGSTYRVVFTDNGNQRFDGDSFNGWTGTLHARITRDDGCTFTWTVKLRITFDANGNMVKEVIEETVTCG